MAFEVNQNTLHRWTVPSSTGHTFFFSKYVVLLRCTRCLALLTLNFCKGEHIISSIPFPDEVSVFPNVSTIASPSYKIFFFFQVNNILLGGITDLPWVTMIFFRRRILWHPNLSTVSSQAHYSTVGWTKYLPLIKPAYITWTPNLSAFLWWTHILLQVNILPLIIKQWFFSPFEHKCVL